MSPPAVPVVALVGLRASGKTTVGRRLAEHLGWAFADTDALLAAAVGRPAGEFLAAAGEREFRRVEAPLVVAALAPDAPTVVALGGGAVCSDAVCGALVAAHIRAFWLHGAPRELARRMALDGVERPPLTDAADPVQELERLLLERESRYRSVAGEPIQTVGVDADAVCAAILVRMRADGMG